MTLDEREKPGLATNDARRQPNPIFIVGQWKCGTTWLLNILSAHPDAFGVDEVDVVRCVYDFDGKSVRPLAAAQRLQRFFNLSGWSLYYDRSGWRNADLASRLEQGEELTTIPGNLSRPQKLMNMPGEAVRRLYQQLKTAGRPEEALGAFLEGVCSGVQAVSHVVLKAADQIAVFDALKNWQPEAKKIVITRDGRDAAISAYHFEKLMREKSAPWVAGQQELDYWGLLEHWAHRAAMIAERARRGELRVIRYEDLTRDFAGTLRPLFDWLQLASSDSIIDAINTQTSFEARTGRSRGTEAKSEMRKGSVGEWTTTLSDEDKQRAWALAGRQLSALGYGPDSHVGPLPKF